MRLRRRQRHIRLPGSVIGTLALASVPAFYGLSLATGQVAGAQTAASPTVGSQSSSGQTAASAQLVEVTGSSLSGVTVSSPGFSAHLTPHFAPDIDNYVLNCPSTASTVAFHLTAASGTITVDGQTGPAESASVSLTTDQAAVLEAPNPTDPSTTTQYWIRCLPTDFPAMKVTTDTDTAPNGYYLTQNTLVGPGSGPYVMILDNHGTPVWWQKTTPDAAGWFDLWAPDVLAWDANGVGGTPNMSDSAGYTTYNLKTGASASLVPNNAPADEHEIVHLSDGNVMFLTSPLVTGVDLSSIGKGTNQNVADCQIQEDNPQGQVVWSWDALSHIGTDEAIYPIEDNINGQEVWDLFHCNSLSLDQAGANQETADVVLSVREFSSVFLIDRATGNVVWKVGGLKPTASDPDAESQYLTIQKDPESAFYAEHDAQLSANNQLTLFDDHSGPPLYSDPNEAAGPARGVQYRINTTAGTATLNWQYVAPDNESSGATGSFNRSSGGTDNIIGWGVDFPESKGALSVSKMFSEVNGQGQVMLAMEWIESGNFPTVNSVYRVVKVAPSQLSLNLLRKNMGGLAS